MTVHKEIGIIIDWESIVMDILKLEKLGEINISIAMQEREERYINIVHSG